MRYNTPMAFTELDGMDQVDFTGVPGKRCDAGEIRIIGLTKCAYCHHVLNRLKELDIAHSYALLDQIPSSARGTLLRALKQHVQPAALLFPILLTDQEVFIAGYNAEVWADSGVDIGGKTDQ